MLWPVRGTYEDVRILVLLTVVQMEIVPRAIIRMCWPYSLCCRLCFPIGARSYRGVGVRSVPISNLKIVMGAVDRGPHAHSEVWNGY